MTTVRSPTSARPSSAVTTAPKRIRAPAPTRTSPHKTAFGATYADGSTVGLTPRCSINMLRILAPTDAAKRRRRADHPHRHRQGQGCSSRGGRAGAADTRRITFRRTGTFGRLVAAPLARLGSGERNTLAGTASGHQQAAPTARSSRPSCDAFVTVEHLTRPAR